MVSTYSDEAHSEFAPHLQTPSIQAELFIELQTVPPVPQTHLLFLQVSLRP